MFKDDKFNNIDYLYNTFNKKALYSYAIELYTKGYKEGLYKDTYAQYEYNINRVLIKYCDILPMDKVEVITRHLYAYDLETLCCPRGNRYSMPYCTSFNRIIALRSNYVVNYGINTIDPYIDAYYTVKNSIQEFISENIAFREYLSDLSKELGVPRHSLFHKIYEVALYVDAYLYYMRIDPDILRQVFLAIMCDYSNMIDLLRMNKVNFEDENNLEGHVKFLLTIKDRFKNSYAPNKKVII